MEPVMKRIPLFSVLCGVLLVAVLPAHAQSQADRDAKMQSAMSAAPPSISDQATIADWPAEEGGLFC